MTVPQEAEKHPPQKTGRYTERKEQGAKSAAINAKKTSRKRTGLKTGRYNGEMPG
jgi:hypothetical protein